MRLIRSQISDVTVNVNYITSIYIKHGVRVSDAEISWDKAYSTLGCTLSIGDKIYLACSNPETIKFYRDELEDMLTQHDDSKIIDLDDLI